MLSRWLSYMAIATLDVFTMSRSDFELQPNTRFEYTVWVTLDLFAAFGKCRVNTNPADNEYSVLTTIL